MPSFRCTLKANSDSCPCYKGSPETRNFNCIARSAKGEQDELGDSALLWKKPVGNSKYDVFRSDLSRCKFKTTRLGFNHCLKVLFSTRISYRENVFIL